MVARPTSAATRSRCSTVRPFMSAMSTLEAAPSERGKFNVTSALAGFGYSPSDGFCSPATPVLMSLVHRLNWRVCVPPPKSMDAVTISATGCA